MFPFGENASESHAERQKSDFGGRNCFCHGFSYSGQRRTGGADVVEKKKRFPLKFFGTPDAEKMRRVLPPFFEGEFGLCAVRTGGI